MYKKDIKLGQILYWNTTGYNNCNISIKCEVVDIGKMWIWVHISGCLAYQNLSLCQLSEKPLYKVTN